jgi:hypothetical protein
LTTEFLLSALLVELLFVMSKRTTMFGYRQVVIFQITFLNMTTALVVPSWVFSCMWPRSMFIKSIENYICISMYNIIVLCKKKCQTTQWPKEKGQNNDLQNTTQKTKDRATRTSIKS